MRLDIELQHRQATIEALQQSLAEAQRNGNNSRALIFKFKSGNDRDRQ